MDILCLHYLLLPTGCFVPEKKERCIVGSRWLSKEKVTLLLFEDCMLKAISIHLSLKVYVITGNCGKLPSCYCQDRDAVLLLLDLPPQTHLCAIL